MDTLALYLALLAMGAMLGVPLLIFRDWLWKRLQRYGDWRRACRAEERRIEELWRWQLRHRVGLPWRGVDSEICAKQHRFAEPKEGR